MTDQNQLIKSLFDDKEIRIIEEDDDLWIPLVDIGKAVGYSSDNLSRTVRNNQELFENFTRTTVAAGREIFSGFEIKQNTIVCVNEQGFYMLLSKIDVNRIENKEVKRSIIEFNRWMVMQIKMIRQQRSNVVRPLTPGEYFKDQMTVANIMHEFLGLDKTLLTTAVITSTEKNTGADFTELKYMLPPVEGIIAVYTATQIGKFFGKEGKDINLILKELGLHEKVNKIWTLTEKGKQYGKPYFEAVEHENNSKWSGIINKWSPDTVELVREYIESK